MLCDGAAPGAAPSWSWALFHTLGPFLRLFTQCDVLQGVV